jgi:Leucine-rich repeat (LRR) protein
VCIFEGVIDRNETVSIITDLHEVDVHEIRWVDFSKIQIYAIPPEVFEKFPNLKGIIASGSGIQEIKPGTFAKASNLEEIHLGNNRLSYLHPDIFKGKQ